MKNQNVFIATVILVCSLGCKYLGSNSNVINTSPSAYPANSATPTPTPIGDITGGGSGKRAYRISGNIDEAFQEGNVCDTSVEFTVPGTLNFKFTPTSPTKGTYKYTGGFNAHGEGPYEIHDDGTMLVDGTGCIMGKCATYSHNWKAKPIDTAACKDGK